MSNAKGPPSEGDEGRWFVDHKGCWTPVAKDVPRWPEVIVDVWVGSRLIDIHWDTDMTSSAALDAVMSWLRKPRVALQCYTALRFRHGAWNSEVFETAEEAAMRIEEVAGFAGVGALPTLMRKRMSLERAYDGKQLIAQSLETWLRLAGRMETGELERVGRIMPHSLVYRRVANDNAWVYAYAGQQSVAAQVLGAKWPCSVIGRRVEDCFSDDAYENKVCADIETVMQRDEARYDHFRAFYRVPDEDPIWLNYERLMLPWISAAGEHLLMVVSARSQDLAIPFLEAASSVDRRA